MPLRYRRAPDLGDGGQHGGVVGDIAAGNRRQRLGPVALGEGQRGLGMAQVVARMGKVLCRHRATGSGGLAPGKIATRGGQRRVGLGHFGVGCAEAGVIGVHLPHGASQSRLGRRHVHRHQIRIQLDQRVAGFHGLRIVSVDGDDRAGLARGDRHDIARHIGIVGALGIGVQQLVYAPTEQGNECDRAEQQQPAAADGAGRGGLGDPFGRRLIVGGGGFVHAFRSRILRRGGIGGQPGFLALALLALFLGIFLGHGCGLCAEGNVAAAVAGAMVRVKPPPGATSRRIRRLASSTASTTPAPVATTRDAGQTAQLGNRMGGVAPRCGAGGGRGGGDGQRGPLGRSGHRMGLCYIQGPGVNVLTVFRAIGFLASGQRGRQNAPCSRRPKTWAGPRSRL